MKEKFTKRQIVILKLCCSGKCSKQIAADLFIENKTVEHHKSNIVKRANAKNMVQVAYEFGKSGD